MQLFSQYNIHPYLTETFLDAFHLYQDNIEIVLIQYVTKEVSF